MANRLAKNFAASGFDVTVEQWKVLVRLWDQDGQTQGDLAKIIGKDKTGLTRLVQGMERRGLIERRSEDKDRRHKRIFLTESGRALQDNLFEQAHATMDQCQAGIEIGHLTVCKAVLRAVIQNAEVKEKRVSTQKQGKRLTSP